MRFLYRYIRVACLAEFIGTFALVFAGCGAIMVDALTQGKLSHVGVSLTFGLIVMAMIYAIGHLSGAHINPAVTLAFAITRHFPLTQVAPYWAAQAAGAIVASLSLWALFGSAGGLGATHPSGNLWQAFVLEFILTYILMFVIMAVATDTRAVGQAAAIAIGGTVGLEALIGRPISGASMNPARSLAPALISNHIASLWIYMLGPFSGAVRGALTYQGLKKRVHHEK